MNATFRDYEVHECASNCFASLEEAITQALDFFDLRPEEKKYLVLTRQQNACFEYCTVFDGAQEDGFRFSVLEKSVEV